ncbi:unnamed protein product, partial [Linum tenue]
AGSFLRIPFWFFRQKSFNTSLFTTFLFEVPIDTFSVVCCSPRPQLKWFHTNNLVQCTFIYVQTQQCDILKNSESFL